MVLVKEVENVSERSEGGYVLVQTESGMTSCVQDACRHIAGIDEAAVLKGPYDLMVHVRGGEELPAARIVTALLALKGVVRVVPALHHA